MKKQTFALLTAVLLPAHFGYAAPPSSCNPSRKSLVVENVYPGKTWTRKTPAEVGLDANKLKQLAAFVGGRGCVVRNGYLVYSWGDVSRRADVASACKPWYTFFLFKALEDGKIKSLDEKLVSREPRLKNLNKKLGYPDRLITWRHCANQISCYQLTEKPGTAYAYNDWQMAMFWDTLFLKVYGATYKKVDDKVLRPLLTDRIQCEDNPTMMAFGTRNRPGRVAVSVRDFARFGLLHMREGNWNGKQLISKKHAKMAVRSPLPNSIPRARGKVAEMIAGQRSHGSRSKPDNQTDHFGSYSWLWWTNGIDRNGTRMFPDAPKDIYGAFGHGGPRAIWVIPSLDIVVSYNDANLRRWTSGKKNPTNTAMKLLMAAVQKPSETSVPSTGKTQSADGETPTYPKWSKIEIAFTGPESNGHGIPNPFAERLDVDFRSPSGRIVTVPGFYDGDGKGGLDGNVWKVRFSADEMGKWSYETKSRNKQLQGMTGRFTVAPVPKNTPGFWMWGRLESVASAKNANRYLKFRDGPYWLKAGCDDPENFLGRYKNYNTLAKRQAAVDYLAKHGINSLYIMTHNIGGDDRDVWPWLGKNAREAMQNGGRNARFDIAKLEEWRLLFEFMQTKGVVPYLILEDDSAWKGYDHARYYREIIARFGYLPALIFNIGEESNENYPLSKGLAFAKLLKETDPYDHPRGIHNVNRPNDAYVNSPDVDFTAIQTGSPGSRGGFVNAVRHNQIAVDWIKRCQSRGKRVLTVNFDEGRPEHDRRAWWSAYLGGGVWEAHVLQPYDRPMSAWKKTWQELGGARAFVETLPFWKMQPRNDLIQSGTAFCLAQPGKAYAVYLPKGGQVTVELEKDVSYRCRWWNPANSRTGKFQNETTTTGGRRSFTAPTDGDWALSIIRNKSPQP